MPETLLCVIAMERRHRYISPQTGKENYIEAKSFHMISLTSLQLKWLERLIYVLY